MEIIQDAVRRWVGTKVKVNWGIWWQPDCGIGWVVLAHPEYVELIKSWDRGEFEYGVVQDLRPAAFKIGRCQWEFLVKLDNGSEVWLPRGTFVLTSHKGRKKMALPFMASLAELRATKKPVEKTVEEAQEEYIRERTMPAGLEEWKNEHGFGKPPEDEGEKFLKELDKYKDNPMEDIDACAKQRLAEIEERKKNEGNNKQ